MPDGRHVVFNGGVGGEPLRMFIQDIATGETRTFAEPGVSLMSFADIAVSSDGSLVHMRGPDNLPYLYPVSGGPRIPIRGVEPGERVIRFSDKGELFVSNLIGIPQHIARVNPATGQRTPLKELMPSQAAGVRRSEISMTPDGRTILFSYSRLLSSLYVVTGLK